MARRDSHRLFYVPEITYGTTPAAPSFQTIGFPKGPKKDTRTFTLEMKAGPIEECMAKYGVPDQVAAIIVLVQGFGVALSEEDIQHLRGEFGK